MKLKDIKKELNKYYKFDIAERNRQREYAYARKVFCRLASYSLEPIFYFWKTLIVFVLLIRAPFRIWDSPDSGKTHSDESGAFFARLFSPGIARTLICVPICVIFNDF